MSDGLSTRTSPTAIVLMSLGGALVAVLSLEELHALASSNATGMTFFMGNYSQVGLGRYMISTW
jgi:hypothetical protein